MQTVPIKVSIALQRIYHDSDSQLIFLNFKSGFGNIAFYQLYFLLFLCLVCTRCTQDFFTTQKQCWWDANTETMHQKLLQLVVIKQERWKIEEKWRFVKCIRHFKQSDKKVRWRCAAYKNRYKLSVSKASKVLTQLLTWLSIYFYCQLSH